MKDSRKTRQRRTDSASTASASSSRQRLHSQTQIPEATESENPNERKRLRTATAEDSVNIPVVQETNEQKECSVCYEDIKRQGILDSCTHAFCYECIFKWSTSSNECPVCKQRFKQIREHQLDGIPSNPSQPVRVPTRNFRLDDFDSDDEALREFMVGPFYLRQGDIDSDSEDEGEGFAALINRTIRSFFANMQANHHRMHAMPPRQPAFTNTANNPVVISDDDSDDEVEVLGAPPQSAPMPLSLSQLIQQEMPTLIHDFDDDSDDDDDEDDLEDFLLRPSIFQMYQQYQQTVPQAPPRRLVMPPPNLVPNSASLFDSIHRQTHADALRNSQHLQQLAQNMRRRTLQELPSYTQPPPFARPPTRLYVPPPRQFVPPPFANLEQPPTVQYPPPSPPNTRNTQSYQPPRRTNYR